MFDINWGILSVVFMWSSLWKEIDLLILELFLTRASICLCGTIFIFLCEANTPVSAICWGRIGTSSSSCLVTLKTILGFCARAPVRPSWKDAVHSTWKNIFDRSASKRIDKRVEVLDDYFVFVQQLQFVILFDFFLFSDLNILYFRRILDRNFIFFLH